MANPLNKLYITPNLVKAYLEILQRDLVVAQTITRQAQNDYKGGSGTSITYKIPGVIGRRNRELYSTEDIISDSLKEGSVPIKLDKEIYNSVQLSETELEYDLENFSNQIVKPQLVGLSDDLEEYVIDGIDEKAEDFHATFNPDNPVHTFIDVRKELRRRGLSADNLYCVAGVEVTNKLLKSDQLLRYQNAGDNDALRRASLGTIVGINIIESNRVDENIAYFYNKNSFILAIRPPVVSKEIITGASATYNGFGFRHIVDFNPSNFVHRSTLHTLVGFNKIPQYVRETEEKDGVRKAKLVEVSGAIKVKTEEAKTKRSK